MFRTSLLSAASLSPGGAELYKKALGSVIKKLFSENNRSWCLCWFLIVYYNKVAFVFLLETREILFCCRGAYQSVKNVESLSGTIWHCSWIRFMENCVTIQRWRLMRLLWNLNWNLSHLFFQKEFYYRENQNSFLISIVFFNLKYQNAN